MKENGGILTARDFSSYRVALREPILTRYRDYTVVGFPPPSSGGVHVAQILNMLETFDLKSLGEAERLHVMAEAMKLAFADRAHWLGDPDFVKVPRGLTDTSYAAALARTINPKRANKQRLPRHAAGLADGCLQEAHHALLGRRRRGQLGRLHGNGQHQLRLQGRHPRHGGGDE